MAVELRRAERVPLKTERAGVIVGGDETRYVTHDWNVPAARRAMQRAALDAAGRLRVDSHGERAAAVGTNEDVDRLRSHDFSVDYGSARQLRTKCACLLRFVSVITRKASVRP